MKSFISFLKSKIFLKNLLIAVAGLVLFIFLIFKWLNISTNHNQKIEVPNLAKMNLAEVETTLSDLELRFVIIDSASYNPSFPKKSVIDQNPTAGSLVKENRKIYLTLNPSGYRNVTIPRVYGKTKRQAISQLSAIGFVIDKKSIFVTDIAKDVVRGLLHKGEKIKTGDKLPKKSVITLKLGNGKGGSSYVER